MTESNTPLTPQERDALLAALQSRFEQNMRRHETLAWAPLRDRLLARPHKLRSLYEMEASGGEPDVVDLDPQTGEYVLFDCALQSPAGRRNLCYDEAARLSRKANRPRDSALEMARAMGVTLLEEAQYRRLQQLGAFDTTTSSWVLTPDAIRERGGALFCDRRYDHVFLYHNGAESYYAARGFRGALRV